ncbi:AAA family ATPase [Streptomyces heliomycini]
MNRTTACAAATGVTLPPAAGRPARRARGALPAPVVRDLRARAGRSPRALLFGPGDLVVVTGLPGSGKSTLMRRTVRGTRVDSQDARDRWDRRVPRLLPYAVYRPLVRLAHYAGLRRVLRTGGPAVVHDCGTQAWVRRWLAPRGPPPGREPAPAAARRHPAAGPGRPARTRARRLRYAFLRHRAASERLLRAVERGALPAGCGSAILVDRDAADTLRRIGFTG